MNKKSLLCACLLFCCGGLYAQSQQVTLHLQNASLKEVFQAIEEQTTYRFSYRNTVVNEEKDINVSAENTDVNEVLQQALEGKNLDYDIVSPKSIVIFPHCDLPGERKQSNP